MKISRVTTNGVGGVPDQTFDFVDPRTGQAANVVVIVGGAGSGKTRLLEAIVAAKEDVGPYGAVRPRPAIRKDAQAAKVSVQWVFDGEDRERFDLPEEGLGSESIFGAEVGPPKHEPRLELLLRRYDHAFEHGKVEYFPANRTLSNEIVGTASIEEFDQKEMRLTSSLRKYGAVPKFLMELGLALHSRDKAKLFAFGFDSLCKTKSPRAVRRTTRGPEILFADPTGQEFGIPELSGSEQQATIFAGTAAMIGLGSSVILVDEPELHHAARDQDAFFRALTALGSNNQWIVATGNRELGAAGDVVVELPDPKKSG